MDHQAAETLSDLVVGNKQQEVVTELFAYMNLLGIQGMGLVDATERSPHIGHIIGTRPIKLFTWHINAVYTSCSHTRTPWCPSIELCATMR